jgi:alpha-L-arabinofuranosidase
MKILCISLSTLLIVSCGFGNQEKLEQAITINVQEEAAELSESMYGLFFEEINHAGDGGLYAELVNNRSFEELEMPEGYYVRNGSLFAKPVADHITNRISNRSYRWTSEKIPGWKLFPDDSTAITAKQTKLNPRFESAPNNLEIAILNEEQQIALINEGYWGMGLTAGDNYLLRVIMRTDHTYKGNLQVKLLGNNDHIIDSHTFELINDGKWKEYSTVLTAEATDVKGRLSLEFNSLGKIWIDYASLFPEKTFKKRSNGLRNDIAEFLVGLKPSFVRWPGGCVVEGITLNNRFEWKKTLGDPASRPGEYSTWGYRNTYGFGYHEFLQFCEDIEADAMFVCNVGLSCQWRGGEACADNQIGYYLQDVMDAIEYALGDGSSEWGKKRVAAGHPNVFPLKYIEIGNENWGDEYDKRFDLFYDTIKEKYPQLVLISNHGIGGTDKIVKTDMIDPHWYAIPEFFFNNTAIFDESLRGKYKVYVGEYACNRSVGAGNMLAALSEASFLTGMERNGDLVTMSSYAPLLENKNDREWDVNLIWFDSWQVVGRSSYYVQQMFADHKPTYMVKSSFTTSKAKPKPLLPGYIGVKTEGSVAEYKDVVMISNTNQELASNMSLKYKLIKNGECTLKFKAKRNRANQGIQVYLGESEDGKTGYIFSVARHASASVVAQYYENNNMIGYVGYGENVAMDNDEWYDFEFLVVNNEVKIYLNNRHIMHFTAQEYPRQFMSTGYDMQAGEIVIKTVNVDSAAFNINVNLVGVDKLEKTGEVITLAAECLSDENSFEQPSLIAPISSHYHKFNKSFTYQFKPHSLTILRIKAVL